MSSNRRRSTKPLEWSAWSPGRELSHCRDTRPATCGGPLQGTSRVLNCYRRVTTPLSQKPLATQRPPHPHRRLQRAQGYRPNRSGRLKQTAGLSNASNRDGTNYPEHGSIGSSKLGTNTPQPTPGGGNRRLKTYGVYKRRVKVLPDTRCTD